MFVTAGGPLVTEQTSTKIMALALKQRIPTLTDFPGTFVDAGCLMTYGATPGRAPRKMRSTNAAARLASSAGALPIELPTAFALLINVRTAKAIGLTIPPSLILRADRIVE